MVLLGDEALVDACFGLAQKRFWTHPIEHLCDMGHVESYFGPFGDIVSVGAR
jgi:hypothetical protein